MQIEDDGHGFDTSATVTGLGLIGIRERAAAIGATVLIESMPEVSTRISVTLVALHNKIPESTTDLHQPEQSW